MSEKLNEKDEILEEIKKSNSFTKRVKNDYLIPLSKLRKAISKYLILEGLENYKFFFFRSKEVETIPEGSVFINFVLKRRSLKSSDNSSFFSEKKMLGSMHNSKEPTIKYYNMANMVDIEVRSTDEFTLIKALHAIESAILIDKMVIFNNSAVDYDIYDLKDDTNKYFCLRFEIKFITEFHYKKFIYNEIKIKDVIFYTEDEGNKEILEF